MYVCKGKGEGRGGCGGISGRQGNDNGDQDGAWALGLVIGSWGLPGCFRYSVLVDSLDRMGWDDWMER